MRKFALAIISVLLASCQTSSFYDIHGTEPTYVPHKMHVPFFSHANQLHAEASISKSFAFAAGYSPFDRLAVVSSLRLNDIDASDSDYHRNHFYDFGFGYFFDSLDALRLEGFARIGQGKTNSSDRYDPFDYYPARNDTTGYYGVFGYDYKKYYVQVNGGWEWDNWALGLSFRGGFMSLDNVTRIIKTLYTDSLIVTSHPNSITTSFFDIGYTARYRIFDRFWMELQIVAGHMNHIVGLATEQQESDSHGGIVFSVLASF